MKTITLNDTNLTALELLKLAEKEAIIIMEKDGKEYVISLIDDFNYEVESLKNNQEFLNFLERRNQSQQKVSLTEARKILGI